MSLQQRVDALAGLTYREQVEQLLGLRGEASDEEIWLRSLERAGMELEVSLHDQWRDYDLFYHLDLLALNARAEARILRAQGIAR
ncbi:hypothetical protein EDE12_106157 [Methylosinus sp. sav-2]|uniref:hypothetical protein n=1 Tax=Methylosinus sp. sav-2 TaxID=2485168 RepID=UPI00047D4E2F|nr:hypothetical protein [Methylosinus sp. sav-2]TDX64012.1 hypothetical protein EDE12_106157 [Methylosinus sp. sav-2]